jgi:hypothetical protein
MRSIVGPDGGFDWTAPDEEVFRFWIDEIRGVGVHLLGRRLYETSAGGHHGRQSQGSSTSDGRSASIKSRGGWRKNAAGRWRPPPRPNG